MPYSDSLYQFRLILRVAAAEIVIAPTPRESSIDAF
jgi:hypothetical protein